MPKNGSIRAAVLFSLFLSFPWTAAPARGEAGGPVEAVEVRPRPCRVPDYDGEVLCATYPVWENRETRQGRKIGLNIVILPALGPDKQPDPVFAFGGGPGEGIAGSAGWYAGNNLRQKRDIVLIDQRGTGRSNPLHCSLYGEPADFRIAAGDMPRSARSRRAARSWRRSRIWANTPRSLSRTI